MPFLLGLFYLRRQLLGEDYLPTFQFAVWVLVFTIILQKDRTIGPVWV